MKLKFNFNETKLMYGLSVVVFACAIGLLGWFVWQYIASANITNIVMDITNDKIEQTKTCDFRRVLDGVCVDSVEKMSTKLVAVMIENHPDARPQSGLSKASIVYEAPVEANYTRFMAIYPADTDASEVGPVRSARPYYLDWLAEYGNAMYMHCGGSPDALAKIKNSNVFDINEFYYGTSFWRSPSRLAPHNVYTSSELWSEIDHGFSDTNFTDWWTFEECGIQNVECGIASTSSIMVNFLVPSYAVEWKYNSSTQKYERWQAGAEHREADGTLLSTDTIIVQHVKTRVIDEIGRLSMETVGTGAVEVYFDGVKKEGKWIKADQKSRTKFFDENNNEIKLKPGKIWIEMINK